MLKSNILKPSSRVVFKKYFETAAKPSQIDENVLKDIDNNNYKPRKHPGIMKTKPFVLSDKFINATFKAVEDFPTKTLLEDSKILSRHLKGRVPQMEKDAYREAVYKFQEKIVSNYQDYKIESEEDEKRYKQIIQDKLKATIKEKIYNWKPMRYNVYNSLVYLFARAAPESAVLTHVFNEIATRDPNFHPKTLFDFGSGIGTATWAANSFWRDSIFEYFNVDASGEMNDLAQVLLQGGKGTGSPLIKGTFYRQFLPASNTSYDLVISAYSLLELPSLEVRLQTILNLWHRTQNYLILVEQGTNAGFNVVNEARDFILQLQNMQGGHIFSPCPHDKVCPKFVANDGTPCNFETDYFSIPINQKSEIQKERYSYVVLKKGDRNNDTCWPRLVRPSLVRSKHTICRMCTASGKLEEQIFTARKHGKTTYHCARASKWGDLLPLKDS